MPKLTGFLKMTGAPIPETEQEPKVNSVYRAILEDVMRRDLHVNRVFYRDLPLEVAASEPTETGDEFVCDDDDDGRDPFDFYDDDELMDVDEEE